MTDEVENLSVAERIRRRREAAAQRNGTTPPTEEKPVEEKPVEREARTLVEEPQPTTRRTEPVPPVAIPENVTPAPSTPRRRRPIVPAAAAEEVSPAPAIELEPLPPTPELVKDEPVKSVIEPEPVAPIMERVRQQAANSSQALILGMLEHMRAGEQLLITRDGNGLWSIIIPTSVVGTVTVTTKPSGEPKVTKRVVQTSGHLPQGFKESLWTQEYKNFLEKWTPMSFEERKAMVKNLGVEIPDGDERIVNMALSMAVQAKNGIEKWLPAYDTKEKRDKAEANAKAGLPW